MARRPAVHKTASSRKVARPQGPNVHGTVVEQPGATLWVAGQLPLVPSTGKPLGGPLRTQAEAVFAQLRHIVTDAGFALDELTSCRIYLVEYKNLAIVDELYRKLFVGQTLPSRTVVPVPMLPEGALLMVEATAVRPAEALAPAPPMDDYGYEPY